jgi:hypothetical protein
VDIWEGKKARSEGGEEGGEKEGRQGATIPCAGICLNILFKLHSSDQKQCISSTWVYVKACTHKGTIVIWYISIDTKDLMV